jgi:hypothetical protein
MLPAALAVARAESFFELPLIGRFLMPPCDDPRPADELSAEALAVPRVASRPPR